MLCIQCTIFIRATIYYLYVLVCMYLHRHRCTLALMHGTKFCSTLVLYRDIFAYYILESEISIPDTLFPPRKGALPWYANRQCVVWKCSTADVRPKLNWFLLRSSTSFASPYFPSSFCILIFQQFLPFPHQSPFFFLSIIREILNSSRIRYPTFLCLSFYNIDKFPYVINNCMKDFVRYNTLNT